MLFRVRGVLVDLDGTLVDSTGAIVRSWVRFAGEYGIGVPELVAARGHGRRSQDVIADLVAPPRRSAAFDRVHALELADLDDLTPVPGAEALLAALPPSSWGIVTSGSRQLAAARLRAAGLGSHVDRLLVTGDDSTRASPTRRPTSPVPLPSGSPRGTAWPWRTPPPASHRQQPPGWRPSR